MKLVNRIAVVTGGSRGIGAAIARKLADEGAIVADVYQSGFDQAQSVVRGARSSPMAA